MSVAKTTIQIVVLHDSSYNLSQWELGDIVAHMNDGEFVGTSEVKDRVLIKNNEVKKELEAIGNDGTFFDM